MASVAFNPLRDTQLQLIDSRHLFPENVANIGIRKGHYLRGYAYRFIELCSPGLDEPAVRSATSSTKDKDELSLLDPAA
jgi:LysR family cys regulon transcriptional activator